MYVGTNTNSVLPGACASSLISLPPSPPMFVNVPSSNKMFSPEFCSVSLRTLLPVSNNKLSPASVDEPSVPSNKVAEVAVPFITIASSLELILASALGIECLLENRPLKIVLDQSQHCLHDQL